MTTCKHDQLVEGYYGHDCAACGELVYPWGCAPWDDDEDYSWTEYGDDDDEWDDMPHIQPPLTKRMPAARADEAGR